MAWPITFELYAAVVNMINLMPNKRTGQFRMPYQIMTDSRPTASLWQFGQTAVIHEWTKGADSVAICGIFLGYEMKNPKSLRVYVPSRKTAYHRLKFEPSVADPDEWSFKRRIRLLPADSIPSVGENILDTNISNMQ